ncbi:protein phosphatase 2 (formerly 2a) regulatory subunit a beta isoform-related [Anaeramoeba flamelloides]|uniref:Protein phosphatase 2 (Formerly 2a) regulatory subunit a beta isoform-related n=1 Tax=Anaeramoeba flamelloides TaxID=1746091 RepID=A0AAV7ZR21_9EUKA|nr:protein phosphatase 2 (formerly 2a) regulatory subunit a beta isoform-related [Anaeramoeba flamelloides]
MTEDLIKVGELIDNLINQDPKLRFESISKIKLIAKTIGEKRTRNELIPFLTGFSGDEDTKTLLLLIKELSGFVELVGGSDYISSIFPPLVKLTSHEDVTVLDQLIEAFHILCKDLSKEGFVKHIYPLFKKMYLKKWFSQRYTACGMIPIFYASLEKEEQEFVRKIFVRFCKNKLTLIRKISCKTLSKLVLLFDQELIISFALPLLQEFHQDSQEPIRIQAVDICISFVQQLKDEQIIVQEIIPIFQTLSEDKSWRIRHKISSSFCQFCLHLNDKIILEVLIGSYLDLLEDDEDEVRAIGSQKLFDFCELIKSNPKVITEKIIPKIENLSTDSCDFVKSSLAVSIVRLSTLIGKEETLEKLLSHQLVLLSEESAKINLPLIQNLHYVSEVVGIEPLINEVLSSINRLSSDNDWRNRVATIKCIPSLAKQFGVESFNEHLLDLSFSWFTDIVHSVREEATSMATELTQLFGSKWSNQFVIPKIIQLSNHQNHLFRQISIYTFIKLAPIIGSDYLNNDVIETIIQLSQDPVPNIKIYLVNSFVQLSKYVEQDSVKQFKNILTQLLEDVDQDVKYFAEQITKEID